MTGSGRGRSQSWSPRRVDPPAVSNVGEDPILQGNSETIEHPPDGDWVGDWAATVEDKFEQMRLWIGKIEESAIVARDGGSQQIFDQRFYGKFQEIKSFVDGAVEPRILQSEMQTQQLVVTEINGRVNVLETAVNAHVERARAAVHHEIMQKMEQKLAEKNQQDEKWREAVTEKLSAREKETAWLKGQVLAIEN